MQIACKRYGCQKAVEVCYWACKYRRNCKDWRAALEGEPGMEAIRERLTSAAARTGRLFDPATLIKPKPAHRLAASRLPVLSVPVAQASGAVVTASARSPQPKAATKTHPKREATKKMAKKITEETATAQLSDARTMTPKEAAPKESASRPRKRAPRARPAANGVVYLILEKNGRYKELREADLLNEAGRVLKDPSLRLIKGQLLVPQITLRPAGE